MKIVKSLATKILRSVIIGFTGPHSNKVLHSYAPEPYLYTSEALAKDACKARTDCNGVTRELSKTRYTLRTGLTLYDTVSGEVSWQKTIKLNKNSEVDEKVLGYVRYVRVQQVGNANFLHMREVQVFDQNGVNRALSWSCLYRCSSRYIRDSTRPDYCKGGKLYGGCSYEGSYTDCVSSCDSSTYDGSVKLRSGGTETEKQVCKFGCGSRSPTATQSSTYNGHTWGPDPASKAVNGDLNDFSCTNNEAGMYHEWTKSNLFVYSTLSFKSLDPLSLTIVVCRRLVGGGFGRGCCCVKDCYLQSN
jgi:hypothetical protein